MEKIKPLKNYNMPYVVDKNLHDKINEIINYINILEGFVSILWKQVIENEKS